MTVAEAISLGQELTGEVEGSPGAMAPRSWLYFLRTALSEVAQAADAYEYSYETDLVAGTNLYCAPPSLYKIFGVQVYDGVTVPGPAGSGMLGIASATARDMRERIDPDADPLRNTGTPTVYAALGAGRILLYPTPSYSTLGSPGNPNAVPPVPPSGYGLIVEGYAKPGDVWVKAPTGLSDMATACPLDSENAQMAAVYRACEMRCKQFRDWPAAEQWHADYVYKKGMYESEVATKTSANRQRMTEHVAGGGYAGAVPSNLGYDPLGRW